MVKTIGNPMTWLAKEAVATGHHVADTERAMRGSRNAAPPKLRKLSYGDLGAALRAGAQDFMATRTDVVFLVIIYPIAGLLLFGLATNAHLLHLLLPIMTGFALLGPVAAVGLYELSRRREAGESATLLDALAIHRSPAFGAVIVLGVIEFVVFVAWVTVATMISQAFLGVVLPWSVTQFLTTLFTTTAGWTVLVLSVLIGFLFAVAVLVTTVISFPLLLDRDIGIPRAVATSIRLAAQNPAQIAAWGVIVAVGLVLGSIPALLGLIIVMPILGHATWHLYRRAVE
jgi:uncharacterized membrane protein